MIIPLTMGASALPKENFNGRMILSGSEIIKRVFKLVATFDAAYKGGDYCTGVLFGSQGASVLLECAKFGQEIYDHKMKETKLKA